MTRVKETFSRYDTAEYLRSPEEMAAYLEACIEEAGEDGDATLIATALGNLARAYGMKRLAEETGISREGLYKALSAKGNPELATFLKVSKALGLELHLTAKVA